MVVCSIAMSCSLPSLVLLDSSVVSNVTVSVVNGGNVRCDSLTLHVFELLWSDFALL